MKEQGLVTRWMRFWKGLFGLKMNQAEMGRSDVVYHNAIRDRLKQHSDLKSALSRLIILRNRADKHALVLSENLAVVASALAKTAKSGDESRGVELIGKRDQLRSAMDTARVEMSGLETQISSAKDGLTKLAESISHLKTEQAKMDARRRHAQARLQASEALQTHSISEFDDSSLGRVRDAVEELEARAGMIEEPTKDAGDPLSMATLRREQSDDRAAEEFRAMQQQASGRLLNASSAVPTLTLSMQEAHS